MVRVRKIMRRSSLIVVTTGAVALSMTGAANASESNRSQIAHSATGSAPGMIAGDAGDCISYLEAYGYAATVFRLGACFAAQAGQPTATKALAACSAALLSSGVNPVVAIGACLAAM